jgi:hypothetical protein
MKRETALIQHPMYLLIREDTTCAERTPPWGEPTIELYIERIRSNLARLREYPQIKIGFEWSALELELLAQDAPDVFAEMCALANEGRVAFYNGTYSQPHLQVQSAEANIRQFEFGSQVYRELCGQNVVTYAHQESSIHDQMPQILEAFGFQYSALPHFPSNLLYLNGGEILLRLGEPHFLHSQEFVRWVGLDGTELPLYLSPRRYPMQEWVTRETAAGLMSGPTLLIENRDLINVTPEWLKEREGVEMVLLDDAFRERTGEQPPQARARHFTYWSYVEGIRAEELSRANWTAEKAVLQLEALDAMAHILLRSTPHNTDALWKRILASQHHDAACFCAPELRGKEIGWLVEVTRSASELCRATASGIAEQMNTDTGQGIPLVVFHTLPQEQAEIVSVEVPATHQRVLDGDGKIVPVKPGTEKSGQVSLQFVTYSKGLGYETYWLAQGKVQVDETESGEPVTFENEFYRATVVPDGTFSSLQLMPSSEELIAQGTPGGNRLFATDSAGISPKLNPGLTGKPKWEIPNTPPELLWQSTSPLRVHTTPLGATITVNGLLGAHVELRLAIDLYHALPRIDFTYAFTFRDASIGIFYLDDTKLRVGWKLGFRGEIHHDIPFGVVKTGEDLPILATSWVDISDGNKGLAFLHRGTFKHWVSDNALYNLFAWGEETNAIGDRIYRENWAKSFDQRLNGIHTIRTAVYPHEGDWRAGQVVGEASSYSASPYGVLTTCHAGALRPRGVLVHLAEPNLVPTGVQTKDSTVSCRIYSIAEQPLQPQFSDSDLTLSPIQTLDGKLVDRIDSGKIAALRFASKRSASE